jgi:hypothetical protein
MFHLSLRQVEVMPAVGWWALLASLILPTYFAYLNLLDLL